MSQPKNTKHSDLAQRKGGLDNLASKFEEVVY
jgi:hypothetical protein